MTSTVDVSILYGACFFESFSLSPNCTGISTGRPGNFIRNLRRVSEHDFLLSLYLLWIYTRSRNENSCLGVSQIAVITITTLTALMSNNHHNQQTQTSQFCKYTSMHVTNYSETELKNRASVWEQRQFDALWGGGPARQGRERQPSVVERSIWMTLYVYIPCPGWKLPIRNLNNSRTNADMKIKFTANERGTF